MSSQGPVIRCCLDVKPPRLVLPRGVESLAADPDLFWPNGSKLRIGFADGSAVNQSRWAACAAEWSKYANIDFAATGSGDYDALVTFQGPRGTYYSYLGTDARSIPRGTPTMVLAGLDAEADEEFFRVARHEIGHLLGCIHEHQSPSANIPWNKPAAYAWYERTQGWTRAEVDAQVFSRYSGPHTQYTAWDKYSIMEYPIDPAFVLDPSYATGWNKELTATDKAFIGQCYPGRIVPPVVLPPVQPPVPPPPVQPPTPPQPTTSVLTVNGGPVADQVPPGHRARFPLVIDHAATYRIATAGPSRTQVIVGQVTPRSRIVQRSAGRRNGMCICWLTPGHYVVDVVVLRSHETGGEFTIEARRIGRS